jgi:hypothetical protein
VAQQQNLEILVVVTAPRDGDQIDEEHGEMEEEKPDHRGSLTDSEQAEPGGCPGWSRSYRTPT